MIDKAIKQTRMIQTIDILAIYGLLSLCAMCLLCVNCERPGVWLTLFVVFFGPIWIGVYITVMFVRLVGEIGKGMK